MISENFVMDNEEMIFHGKSARFVKCEGVTDFLETFQRMYNDGGLSLTLLLTQMTSTRGAH